MARTITITDGVTSVSLLDTSGYQLQKVGWKQSEPSARTVWRSSMFTEGRAPVLRAVDNVVEDFKVNLTGSSHDNLAAEFQKLVRLLRQARNYHLMAWEQEPVYLKTQLTGETLARYAVLYDARIEIDQSLFDAPTDPGNRVNDIKISVEREPYWRSHVPLTLPSGVNLLSPEAPTPQADVREQYVSNFRGEIALDKIYSFDASGPSFSSDLSASTSFNYFKPAGATPVAGDMMYFGATRAFFQIVLNIGTAFVGTAPVYIVEYWDGGSWTAGGDVGTEVLEGSTGLSTLTFNGRTDWASTTINSQDLYWVRIRIVSVSVWTTAPAQAGQIVYAVADTYIELTSGILDGDLPALTLIRFRNQVTDGDSITHAIMGIKSRGLTYFTSRLNCNTAAANPGSWAVTHFTDTGNEANPLGPDGRAATCSFDTVETLARRVRFINADQTEVIDYEGTYAIFVRVEQENGDAGDVSVGFRLTTKDAVWSSRATALQFVDSGPEVVHLGTFTLGGAEVRAHEKGVDLIFDIRAKSDNGATPDLVMYDLVLMPIDEWGGVVAEPGPITDASISALTNFELDSGILRKGATLLEDAYDAGNHNVVLPLEARGQLPMFEPSRKIRLYFLFHDDSAAHCGMGGAVSLRFHERWLFLRGVE